MNLQEALKEKQLRKFTKERVLEITKGMEVEAVRRMVVYYGEVKVGKFGWLYKGVMDEIWGEYGRRN